MKPMKRDFGPTAMNHPLTALASDFLGAALVIALVWGVFSILFKTPNHGGARAIATSSSEIPDSVLTTETDEPMLADQRF